MPPNAALSRSGVLDAAACTGAFVADDGGHTRLVRGLNTTGTSTPEIPT